ncbi:hypothetical protein FAM09_01920 [Niastella caeni]|uniref:Uncharacterized protein n=1 Tax=Niastella caeni TaxID=2569763 RepID=A0A4V6T3V0_9BACT|nr:hypothetical protein [Niastella caeni]THU40896.1 hypothetical protein FAM09_01920 [Niastella caeni]
MNSVFDLKRWSLYIGKHWNENKKRYLLSLGAIGGLLILWYSFLMLVNGDHPISRDIQAITYYVGLFLTGCLYASIIFNELSDGPKGIQFLLIPVSVLEKLLTAILFGVVLYFICYTVIFYIVDFPMVNLANSIAKTIAEQEHRIPYPAEKIANVFVSWKDGDNILVYFLLAYLSIQSIFLMGSVYFVRFQYIKTLVSGLVVFLFLMFFVHKVLGSFMPPGGFFKPFTVYRVFVSNESLSVHLPEWISTILLFLIKYSFAPMFWVVTYLRLKEKEV